MGILASREGADESSIGLIGGGGGGPQQIVERGGGEVLPGELYLDREYVYGPDYVDEFIAQFDRDGHAIFMFQPLTRQLCQGLQDGNYNVVALVSGPGHPGGMMARAIRSRCRPAPCSNNTPTNPTAR